MNKEEYEKLFELEERHWWYAGLRDAVFHSLKKFSNKNKKKKLILDAGCGAGFLLLKLDKFGKAFGIDISREAIFFCRKRRLNRLIQGSVSCLPCKRDTFDVIVSLDVLYHKYVDCETDTLLEFHNALRPDGLLIINVPAFEFVRSRHDLAIHTKKRYTKEDLRRKIEGAGFGIEKITYRNIILFPFIMLFRIRKKLRLNLFSDVSDLRKTPLWLNNLLFGLLRAETLFFSKFYAPFGLSVYCVARKK